MQVRERERQYRCYGLQHTFRFGSNSQLDDTTARGWGKEMGGRICPQHVRCPRFGPQHKNKETSKQATKPTDQCLKLVRPLRVNFILRVLACPMGYSTDQLVNKWIIRRWNIVGRSRSTSWLPRMTWLSCYAVLPHHVTMYPAKSTLKPLRC